MSLKYGILAFLDLEPTTGYTLGQRFSGSVGSFWTATQSQIYRELHQLERDGLAEVEVVPQDGKPARKVYAATAAGRAALEHWLTEPVGAPVLRDPFMLKFVFAGNAPPGTAQVLLEHYRSELTRIRSEYLARLDLADIFDLARSPREALVWRLSLENGLAWCEAQITWADDAAERLRALEQQGKEHGATG